MGKPIGKGAYGSVYDGNYMTTTPVALKKLAKNEARSEFIREANIMKVSHVTYTVSI